MMKDIVDYIKDNPEGYWFKAKLYGWGWMPAKREGWAVILVFLLFLLWNGWRLGQVAEPTPDEVLWFCLRLFIAVVVLIAICYKTGERPRWQWGVPKNKKRNSSKS